MRRFFAVILLIVNVLCLFAQDADAADALNELTMGGNYAGGNLYVMNPSDKGAFSVQSVMVNGKEYAFNKQSSAFEINLAQHEPNDFIFVQIQYSAQPPKVVNGECLKQESEFACPSFLYNKKSKMIDWKIEELKAGCSYKLEQMLYGKWVTVKDLGTPNDMISSSFLPVLLTGMNLFRLMQEEGGKTLSSPIVKIKSPNRKILLLSEKVKDFIEFTGVTHYVLYDENGFFIKRGTAQKVNVADLKKGNYWINFDGKETMVTKK